MLWVLWDIVLPLIATFLMGLLVGWLLWRWRRSRIDAEDLSRLRRTSARNTADFERLQQSNIELSDRVQAANGSAGRSAGNGDLASAKERIETLAEELKYSREEVAQLKSSGSVSGAVHDDASIEMQELQRELDLAQSRITQLESADQGFNSSPGLSADEDLRKEIAARDRMIITLEESLQQFGESGDTTTLMADIVLRDRKIDELESMVATLKR